MYLNVLDLSNELEAIGERIVDFSIRHDNDAMRQIIAARRELSAKIPELVSACAAAIGEMPESRSAELHADLSKLSSQFRKELANLQSKWPSVVIRSDPEGYAIQKRKLDIAHKAFFGWLVDHLLPKLRAA
jgi:hypothetical protein